MYHCSSDLPPVATPVRAFQALLEAIGGTAREVRDVEPRVDGVLRIVVRVVRGVVPLLDREAICAEPDQGRDLVRERCVLRPLVEAIRPLTGDDRCRSGRDVESEDAERERVPRVRARIRLAGDAVFHRALERGVERPPVGRDRDPLEAPIGPEVDAHRLGEGADDRRSRTRGRGLGADRYDPGHNPAVRRHVHDARQVLVRDPERPVARIDDETFAVDSARARSRGWQLASNETSFFGAARTE